MCTQNFSGLSDSYVTLRDATVFAHAQDNTCGVLNAEGLFCPFSRGVMGPRRAADAPTMPQADDIATLKGRYLYGGWLRAHFGHFLLESTARLWALGDVRDRIDGVIFTPFRSGGAGQAHKRYAVFLDILTDNAPIKIIRSPTRVAELIVADPGFGHHDRVLGSPKYRNFSRAQVAKAITAQGAERIYISRSALMDKRGGIFGEPQIEAMMEANGYTVFHPQKHSIPVQLAQYKAAREIISLDGSALHMAAYALQPGTRVGMILRRHAPLLGGLAEQMRLFAGAEVHVFDTLRASWVDEQAKRIDFRSLGELDFTKLQGDLTRTGFISTAERIGACDIPALLASMDRGAMRRIPL